MADGSTALSPIVVRATDPRAIRKQTVGRGLIALVWVIADIGQIVIGGSANRAGDGPLVGFAGSALIGVVLLCGLATINFRAVRAAADRARRVRLLAQARLIGWLCTARLVAIVPVLLALRSLGEAKDRIPQVTFMGLAILALFDAAVALGIAAGTIGALRRSIQAV